MPNVPYVTGNETQQTLTSGLQIDHAGKYLFYSVVESTAAAPGQASQAGVIYAFAIGSTGELTLQSRLVTQYGSGVGASAVDPLGRYVYFDVDTGDGPGVAVISVNSETGALSEVAESPFVPTKTGPSADYGLDLVADPSGKFLYALQQTPDPNTSTVVSFSIDPNSGALDPVGGRRFPSPRIWNLCRLGLSFRRADNFSMSWSRRNFGIRCKWECGNNRPATGIDATNAGRPDCDRSYRRRAGRIAVRDANPDYVHDRSGHRFADSGKRLAGAQHRRVHRNLSP